MGFVRERVYEGGEGDWQPPVSRAEQLMKAHPDITVIREHTGEVFILQTFPDNWRHIWIDVEQEKDSHRHYPNVTVTAFNTPIGMHRADETKWDFIRYGLVTVARVHVEDDEQVTPEVGYRERKQYPPTSDMGRVKVRFIKRYSHPIPAHELIATARTGLEMLKAYREASPDQRERINDTLTGYHGHSQIVDDTRIDMDEYLAEVAKTTPFLGAFLKADGVSYNHARLKSVYALNALNKVSDNMLPVEMPPAPPNSREPRRKTTTNVLAPRRRTPSG